MEEVDPQKRKERLSASVALKNVSATEPILIILIVVTEKRRQEAGPTRVGRKKKKRGVEQQATKIPNIVPHSKCRLRLMRQERVKDYLLMEEEFIKNQELLKPIDESRQKEMLEIDKLRGMPLKVGDLEEIIDDDHAIVAPHAGLEYYVPIFSIVDKD